MHYNPLAGNTILMLASAVQCNKIIIVEIVAGRMNESDVTNDNRSRNGCPPYILFISQQRERTPASNKEIIIETNNLDTMVNFRNENRKYLIPSNII